MKYLLMMVVSATLVLNSAVADAVSDKKRVQNITNKEITRRGNKLRQPGPAGPAGEVGPMGVKGSKGSPGIELFAHVLANGTVVPEDSYGITQANVTTPGNSRYCFTGLPYVNVAIVTADVFNSTPGSTTKFSRRNNPECDIFVQIYNAAGQLTTGGFYMMLY